MVMEICSPGSQVVEFNDRVRLSPQLEITVDEYWSRVMGVDVVVGVGVGDVDVVHPNMTVAVSMVTLVIRRIRSRFMLLLISLSL